MLFDNSNWQLVDESIEKRIWQRTSIVEDGGGENSANVWKVSQAGKKFHWMEWRNKGQLKINMEKTEEIS